MTTTSEDNEWIADWFVSQVRNHNLVDMKFGFGPNDTNTTKCLRDLLEGKKVGVEVEDIDF